MHDIEGEINTEKKLVHLVSLREMKGLHFPLELLYTSPF